MATASCWPAGTASPASTTSRPTPRAACWRGGRAFHPFTGGGPPPGGAWRAAGPRRGGAGALRFQPFKGEEPAPGEIWRIDGPGRAEVVAEDVLWANGIGFSPDGGRMYVSDYARRAVLAFPGGDVFAAPPEGECDGLAVDAEGGVWVALGSAGGVARFTEAGDLDQVVDVPAEFVSSIAFGGNDGRDVAITTIGALFTGRCEVAGLPVAPATL